MELNSIKDAFERVTKKQKLTTSKSQEAIEQITQEINTAISLLQTTPTPTTPTPILTDLKSKLKTTPPFTPLESTQKDLNIAFSKYTKLLEKQFNPDISKSYRHIDFPNPTINQIIATHLYREGLFDIADSFSNNSPITLTKKTQFLEMHQILNSMNSHDLVPALNWATKNRESLKKNGSDIELKLHRLQFMEIVKTGHRDDALKYARAHFSNFPDRLPEIQKLMACLLWIGRLERSPYTEFLSPTHWVRLGREVTREFCGLIGESCESPLGVVVSAGVQGLPTLLKLMNVMVGKKEEWCGMKQLPVPVDLDQEFQFHSIFVCPVSRDQAGEDNPPMLMSCGHVLCKQSITKLSKNNSARPFKCPYCPTEVEVGQCRQLYF